MNNPKNLKGITFQYAANAQLVSIRAVKFKHFPHTYDYLDHKFDDISRNNYIIIDKWCNGYRS